MNPQYMPQSQFGAPQQGFPPGKQAPGVSQPGLQDTFAVNSNLPPPQTGGYMQAQQPYGYKGPMGSSNTQNNAMPPPMVNPMNQQPPPRQVGPPPMQGTSQNTFNLPPHMQPNQLQNGPMTNSAPSSQPGQNPVANSGNQPPSTGQLGGAPLGPPPNNMGLNGAPYLAICPPHPSGLNQSMGPPPPSNSMGMPPMPPSSQSMGMPPMPPSSQSMGMPPSSQSMGMPPSSQSMGMPPSSQPMSMPPSSQPMGMPPSSQSMGMPPSSQSLGMPPSQPMGMPPTTGPMGMPPTTGSMGMPPTTGSMNMPPTSGSMSMPPTTGSMSMPPTTGSMGMTPTSGSMSMPPPSGPMNMPPPSGIKGMPPTGPSINPPPSNGPPPGPPQMGSMGPPIGPGQIGSPKMPNTMGSGPGLPPGPGQMEGSSQMGPPQMLNQVGAPNSGPGGPPLSNTTSRPGQIPNQSNYPLPGQMPPMPPSNMQTKSPLMPQMNSMGAPHMGGQNQPLPRGNNAGMPPMPPNQGQYSNKLGSSYPNMPPPSNQQYNPTNTNYGPNQLTNQMNEMHLNSNRQYPGGPMKSAINGDNSMNSPHMPPPMPQNQGQYINGSQNRATQPLIGYPPMPGQQQQMPGQQHQMPGQQHQMPGQQHQMPGGPYPSQAQYQQPQQPRRLDPDQMPSPIQVTLDDQKTRSGIFCTNQKGLVPPLVSTSFITQDQGNAGPRFIRSTMYNVPTTSDMMKQTAVPFGLVISPLARTIDQEYPPPIVDFGELGPVRCIRCKAYMCPFMQFIDSGRRFQCLFCKATTEVPAEYFQHLDHTGQRVDRYERPELILGTYEFVATKDYCRNNTFPKPPAIIFVIDVSYNNVKSGLVHLICAEMKEILKHLPIDQGQERSKMKVGFITYNSTVHFYNIKGTLAQPQMMVVGDTQEMFVPLLDGFLCDIEESAAVIDSLMAQIPAMFAETRETETVLMPAIQAGLEALKASECAGKLLVFHSTLPTAEAPGRLKNRDERKLLGTEKERTVLTPQNQAYNQLGQDCVSAGCSVDLFITNNSYIDIATIGQVARLTGGEIFKYTYFQADVDGQRLVNDIITDINRPIAFDSIMRVRTSTGVRPTNFYGHFFMSNTTDMEIAAIDCDKAVAIEIKHDDKLTEEEGVYIQVALLYTSCSGQRRLRILNLSLKTCSQMADLYRSCELDTIVNFFSKQCVYKLLENNPKVVKDSLVNRCAQMLACYRKNCASPSSAGQLILPECMKLLPLYVNCLLKSDAISGGSDMTLDDRSFVMQSVITMDIPTSVVYFYPRLIPLHEIQNGTETPEIPNSIRCTVEKMVDNGVYLLENGIHMLIWIGLNANQEWIQNVFGAPSAAQVDIDRISLPEIDNSLNIAVRNLIDQIRAQRHRCMRLTLVRQKDKLETVFRHFLMEDRGQDGSSSYVDFLCHMHKEIRQLLS